MGILVKICIGIQAVLLVYSCGVHSANGLKCTGTTFYRVKENGQAGCKECRGCKGGGIGWNTTVVRKEDEHGFMSCYPCAECPRGTFRELRSADSECKPCRLDCLRVNRYISVRCGGGSPGHCGDCMIGYTAHSKEPNSMCRKPPTTQGKSMPPTRSPQTTLEPRPSVYDVNDNYPLANLSIWIPCGILLLLILTVISCAVFAARYKKSHSRNKKTESSTLAKEVDSSKALIGSGSTLGEDNVEVDGVDVRGERPECLTIEELEAMRIEENLPPKRAMYGRILNIDDETLTVVAKNVSGERRHELFNTYLKIDKSKTDPEQEKWEKGIISFSDYILEVLKIWLQKADKDATLEVLCKALQMASFGEVEAAILDLPENKAPPTNVEIKDTVEITITGE